MKDSEKALLLGLAGVGAAVASFMLVARPNYAEKQSIDAEIVQLESRLAYLSDKEAHREQFLADTDKYNAEFEQMLQAFPADLNQEITIMFLDGIKKNNDFSLESLTLGQKEQFYTLGQGGGDASLGAPDAAATTDEAATDETGATETETTDTVAPLEEGIAGGTGSSYDCFRASFPITYYGSYASLKDVINYVDSYSDRMTINTLDVSYDPNSDVYSGSLDLYCYSIESAERDERRLDLNEVEIGVDNIFDTGASGSSENSSLNKYNENGGAAIESNYDFYAMLNAASSDVSAKVVGQNGAGKEASVISNSDNTVSTLTFEFYEQNGKNYCKYTLDNSTSYEAEVTSAEDVKLLIQSSARKNDDDSAGVRVTIRNTSSIPVYVKVSGDDAVSPRVTIASTTGAIKVYK